MGNQCSITLKGEWEAKYKPSYSLWAGENEISENILQLKTITLIPTGYLL